MRQGLGEFKKVGQRYLREGETILLGQDPHSVVFRRPLGRGSRFLVEDLKTRKRRQMWCDKDEMVYRLNIPRQDVGQTHGWKIAHGDVVVYPGKRGAATVAVIRHLSGWYSTTSRRIPLADAQIVSDVRDGKAVVVRSDRLQPVLDLAYLYRVGSVIAVQDPTVPDPTVWVRTEHNLWRSSTGVEASDAMIRFEMGRKTYVFVAAAKII